VSQKNKCENSNYVAGIGCVNQAKCVASNPCVVASCKEGECSFNFKNCDDGNACTTDKCDLLSGLCSHKEISCEQQEGSIVTCNPTNGICEPHKQCVIDFDCDDSNDTTFDLCDKGICRNPPKKPREECIDDEDVQIYIESKN